MFYLLFLLFQMETERPTVAVFDFEEISCREGLGKGVAELVLTHLAQSGKFKVVERAQLLKVLKEQKMAVGGLIDEQTAVEMGKLLGAKYVVLGSVFKSGMIYTLNARFINVETAEVEFANSVTCRSESEFPYASKKLIYGMIAPKSRPSLPEKKRPIEKVEKPEKKRPPNIAAFKRGLAEGYIAGRKAGVAKGRKKALREGALTGCLLWTAGILLIIALGAGGS